MTDALKRYQELTANGADPASPVERLRAFCSLAMGGQDWLDVEPFFDAILDHVEAQEAEIERLTAENGRLRADLLAGRNVVNAGLTIHTLTIERDMLRQEIERLTAERDELRRQLAEAEQDARRYRWLRANREFCVAAYPEGEWVIPAGMVFLGYSNPDADSWIDAAMGASDE